MIGDADDRIRILATARDVGAATNIGPVAAALRAQGAEVNLVASDAAARFFDAADFDHQRIRHPTPYAARPSCAAVNRLIGEIDQLLAAGPPDVVLCGLSNFRFGLDDLTMALARKRFPSAQRVLLLDAPGCGDLIDDTPPHLVLATNDTVASWVRAELMCSAVAIGSARRYDLAGIPADELRRSERRRAGLAPHDRLILFMGQQFALPGHGENFRIFCDVLKPWLSTGLARLIVRPHPSFRQDVASYRRAAGQAQVPFDVDRGSSSSPMMAACDALVAVTSTSTDDYQWLASDTRHLHARLGHLLLGSNLRCWLDSERAGWRPNAVLNGTAHALQTRNQVRRFVSDVISGRPARRAASLSSGIDPAQVAADTILDLVRTRDASASQSAKTP